MTLLLMEIRYGDVWHSQLLEELVQWKEASWLRYVIIENVPWSWNKGERVINDTFHILKLRLDYYLLHSKKNDYLQQLLSSNGSHEM